jgi:hypothetical protein
VLEATAEPLAHRGGDVAVDAGIVRGGLQRLFADDGG